MRYAFRRSAVLSLSLLIGCAQTDPDPSRSGTPLTQTTDDTTKNAIGLSSTVSPTAIDLTANNPFFRVFGTNNRQCGTCHHEEQGWTITPEFARTLPANDPLFVFDGSDCLPPGVANPDPSTNSKAMLGNGLVRIELKIPDGADYKLVDYTDPLGCPTLPAGSPLRFYRRPLPTSNTAFLSTVMWDGRENQKGQTITTDLATQANDATTGHAQATSPLGLADRNSIVGFETMTFNAQRKIGSLSLTAGGANGGGEYLYENVLPSFFIGINDVFSPTFNPAIFDIYKNWEPGANPPTTAAATIGRGERVFNTKKIHISGVAGINGPFDTLGEFDGFCGTCHDTPNIGHHSVSLPIDIGITAAQPAGGLDVANLPVYTFESLNRFDANGQPLRVRLTDGGRGIISGKFADLGKTKGPILRGLSSRAPYFHNGSAANFDAVLNFYEARFNFKFTALERNDLIAFLAAL
jgi:hypothetical protein